MKFGTNFGLQKRSSGGSVIQNPYEFDFANPKIIMSGTGTYVLTPIIDGFELELFGNGNKSTSPTVALSLFANLPKDTKFKIEFVYTVIRPSPLFGTNYQNYFGNIFHRTVTQGFNTTSILTAPTNNYNSIQFYFNSTRSGKIKISGVKLIII